MAQSEVDVANRALIRLGLQTITAATSSPATFASAITNGDSKNSTARFCVVIRGTLQQIACH
jgi:hypothetical protein